MRMPPEAASLHPEPGYANSIAGSGFGGAPSHVARTAGSGGLREVVSSIAAAAIVLLSAGALVLAVLAAIGAVRIPAELAGVSAGALAIPIVVLTALSESIPEEPSDELRS